jgi:hypothetical protein
MQTQKVVVVDKVTLDDSQPNGIYGKPTFHLPTFTVTKLFLDYNPTVLFVFGDNTIRKGFGGAAALRNCENAYGFITKKFPNNKAESFYTLEEYSPIFIQEFAKLIHIIENNPNRLILISKLGGGLANKHHIFENIIQPNLEHLSKYNNVTLLY